jgi:cation diffusion facilitator CzcD-associated flavoprotein CzcO
VSAADLTTSCVVIGAGQAGLSVAFYLRRLGLEPGEEFVVLDRGPGTGGAWQHRWEALRLGSAHRVNDLPGMEELELSFATADHHAPARDVVGDYYRRYEEHFGLQVVRPATVTHVRDLGAELLVRFETDNGTLEVAGSTIVNATGTWGAPFVPHYPGIRSFAGRHVHTSDYAGAEDFADQDVVVVGAGTSAIGFILELEPHARSITWATRRAPEFRDETELNLEAAERAVALQDDAARAGRALPSIVSGTGVPRTRRIQAAMDRGVLEFRPMFDRVEADGVRWDGGDVFQPAQAIVWATGFRPELRHLAPLKLREKEGGVTVASHHSERDPRVFFAGYGPAASTIGANRAGRNIARQVVATLSKMGR